MTLGSVVCPLTIDADHGDQGKDERGQRLEERGEHDAGGGRLGRDLPLPVEHVLGRDVGRPGDRAHHGSGREVGTHGVRPGQPVHEHPARAGVRDVRDPRGRDEDGELRRRQAGEGRPDGVVVDEARQHADEHERDDPDQDRGARHDLAARRLGTRRRPPDHGSGTGGCRCLPSHADTIDAAGHGSRAVGGVDRPPILLPCHRAPPSPPGPCSWRRRSSPPAVARPPVESPSAAGQPSAAPSTAAGIRRCRHAGARRATRSSGRWSPTPSREHGQPVADAALRHRREQLLTDMGLPDALGADARQVLDAHRAGGGGRDPGQHPIPAGLGRQTQGRVTAQAREVRLVPRAVRGVPLVPDRRRPGGRRWRARTRTTRTSGPFRATQSSGGMTATPRSTWSLDASFAGSDVKVELDTDIHDARHRRRVGLAGDDRARGGRRSPARSTPARAPPASCPGPRS